MGRVRHQPRQIYTSVRTLEGPVRAPQSTARRIVAGLLTSLALGILIVVVLSLL